MSVAIVLEALALPSDARVDQRITKKLLVEQAAQTAVNKRQIQDGIEELKWVAALKPINIGVPKFHSSEREYLEIAVISADFRPNAKVPRLIELIHRAIPYPLLLVSSYCNDDTRGIAISAAHKRFAQSETGKFVLDEILTTDFIPIDAMLSETVLAFLNSLALSTLSTRNLYLFYQGWINSIVGLAAAGITGKFSCPESTEQMHSMRKFVAYHSQILDEVSALRMQASKEKQINRLVALNIEIKRLEAQLTANQSALDRTHHEKN